MKRFVKVPNLPENCSGIIICDRYYDIFKNKLESLNICTIKMPDNIRLPESISYHTDLSVFHAGDNRLFISRSFIGSEFANLLSSHGFILDFFQNEQNHKYPDDTGGNVCYLGKYIILNNMSADPGIKKYLDSKIAVRIKVKQGYTKCSICALDENSIITGDSKTAEKAAAIGMDVLYSDPDYIELEGFSHGFIGGSTFKISRDKLCFTGVLDRYPADERNKIFDFCYKKNIEPIFLSERPIFDIGGAVPVIER